METAIVAVLLVFLYGVTLAVALWITGEHDG